MKTDGSLPAPEFYNSLFNILPYPVFIKDREHTYIMANDAYCRTFNIDRDYLIGKKDDIFFPEEEYKVFFDNDRKVLTTGEPQEFEEYATTVDGARRRYRTIKSLLVAPDRKKFIVGITQDLTELKLVQDQIRQKESLYRNLVDNLPNLVLIHRSGKVVFCNDTCHGITGYKSDEVKGMSFITLVYGDAGKGRKTSLYNLITSPASFGKDIEIQAKDFRGMAKQFSIRTSRVVYEDQDAFMSILTDITDRKQHEQEIIGKIIETEERERGRIAADLHDDIGPILSCAKLYLDYINSQELIPKVKERVTLCTDLLNDVIGKMRSISDNLMPRLIDDYGLESGVSEFCDRINLSGLVSITVNSRLGQKRFPKESELHFFRIITELINNSIKHSGSRNIELHLNHLNNTLKLVYSDGGKGYNVEEILKKTGGMGIHNIFHRVNLMNGTIAFLDREGKTEVRIQKKIFSLLNS
jgi:PAS domain S-box-containing protein